MNFINDFRTEIDEFNSKIVDIHCSLTKDISHLNELLDIQNQLDSLTTEFYSRSYIWWDIIKGIKTDLDDRQKRIQIRAIIQAFWIFIPYIGLLLAIAFLLYNYYQLRIVSTAKKMFETIEKEVENKYNITKANIDSKYAHLNSKIALFSGNGKELQKDEDYIYYSANEIINDFINGFEIMIEPVDPVIQNAIRSILQKELNSQSNDINELLKLAKEKSNEVVLKRQKY